VWIMCSRRGSRTGLWLGFYDFLLAKRVRRGVF
jgi:hypothetical protein